VQSDQQIASEASRLNEWLLSSDTGASSKAIAAFMTGLPGGCGDYPYDPADLGRCLRLLEKFPEWERRLAEMAVINPGWAGFVGEWDNLKSLMVSEVGVDWSKGKAAPETYRAMRLAIANGYRQDERYVCRFYEDGTLLSAYLKSEL